MYISLSVYVYVFIYVSVSLFVSMYASVFTFVFVLSLYYRLTIARMGGTPVVCAIREYEYEYGVSLIFIFKYMRLIEVYLFEKKEKKEKKVGRQTTMCKKEIKTFKKPNVLTNE